MKKIFFSLFFGLVFIATSVLAKDNPLLTADFWKTATVKQVQTAINNGANVNAKNRYRETPLLYAIKRGNIEIIKSLISAGADANIKSIYGQTPLKYALYLKKIEIIEALVENNIALSLKYSNKYWQEASFEEVKHNVLMYSNNKKFDDFLYQAIKNGQGIDTIEFLVKGNYKIKDKVGKTLLMYAVEYNQSSEVIQFLINNGADVNAIDKEGKTLLMYAIEANQSSKVIQLLIDNGADVNAQDKHKNYVIEYALKINPEMTKFDNGYITGANQKKITSIEIFEVLIKNNVNLQIKTQNKRGFTYGNNLLQNIDWIEEKFDDEQVKQNFLKMLIESLVSAGIDINQPNKRGETPLFEAVYTRNLHLIQTLLENGADINSKDNYGKTLLMNAAMKKNNLDVLKFLIENGADVNAKDKDGETAFIYSLNWKGLNKHNCENNLIDAKFLLENGADINVKDNKGKTVLFYTARYSDKPEEAKFLIENGLDPNDTDSQGRTPLIFAAQEQYLKTKVLEFLIEQGADVNAKDNKGTTALMLAAKQLNEYIVKLLISKNADVDAQDNNGLTALMYYVSHPKGTDASASFAELIKNKANVNIKDNSGLTALMHFANTRAIFKNKYEIKTLIENGANVNARDNKGRTALMFAVTKLNFAAAKILIDAGANITMTMFLIILFIISIILLFRYYNNKNKFLIKKEQNILLDNDKMKKHLLINHLLLATVFSISCLIFKPCVHFIPTYLAFALIITIHPQTTIRMLLNAIKYSIIIGSLFLISMCLLRLDTKHILSIKKVNYSQLDYILICNIIIFSILFLIIRYIKNKRFYTAGGLFLISACFLCLNSNYLSSINKVTYYYFYYRFICGIIIFSILLLIIYSKKNKKFNNVISYLSILLILSTLPGKINYIYFSSVIIIVSLLIIIVLAIFAKFLKQSRYLYINFLLIMLSIFYIYPIVYVNFIVFVINLFIMAYLVSKHKEKKLVIIFSALYLLFNIITICKSFI